MIIRICLALFIIYSCNNNSHSPKLESLSETDIETLELTFESESYLLFPQQLSILGIYDKNDELDDFSNALIQRLFILFQKLELAVQDSSKLLPYHYSFLNRREQNRNCLNYLNKNWSNLAFFKEENFIVKRYFNFLLNSHSITSHQFLQDYISRIRDLKNKLRTMIKIAEFQKNNQTLQMESTNRITLYIRDSLIINATIEHPFVKRLDALTLSELDNEQVLKYKEDIRYIIEYTVNKRLEKLINILTIDSTFLYKEAKQIKNFDSNNNNLYWPFKYILKSID